MQTIKLNTGLVHFHIDNGTAEGATLSFNPSDPGVYSRFMELYAELPALAEKYEQANETDDTAATLAKMAQIDAELKGKLAYVFGESNDFNAIFGGVNVVGTNDTGSTVIESFMEAILPALETSASKRKKAMEAAAKEAVQKAAANRQQRRAASKP